MSRPKQNSLNLPMIIMTWHGKGVLVEAGRWTFPLNVARLCLEKKPYLPSLRRVMLGTTYSEALRIITEEDTQ
jgi:hypothetical protein